MWIALLIALCLWTPDIDRATLEARYLDAPADRVEVAGVRLHVRDSGPKDAPALLLIHGFGASLHTWEPWARTLAREHRVIRLDLPGSGLSEPDPTGDYTDARSVQLLLALLDQRGIERATLVGHSIGGRIAWMFAARHPERIDRLVLIAPDGFASPGEPYGQAPDVPVSMQLMRHVLPRALLRTSLAPAYADPAALSPELVTRYHDLMRAPGSREALLARLQQTVRVDPRPLLHSIQAPTLLIWGERDAMIPFANSADYLAALPHATLAALPDVGHLPHEEAPERSLVPLLDFLARPR
ncbi:MAG: alpha/beta hydrolase [Burkholderiales bacterium 28-67-8]|nr:MAG: alpha/beta hydrolase [Burkholderiales bacterium 28-67-8]